MVLNPIYEELPHFSFPLFSRNPNKQQNRRIQPKMGKNQINLLTNTVDEEDSVV